MLSSYMILMGTSSNYFFPHQGTNIPIFEVFTPGLRHLALTVKDIDATFFFSNHVIQCISQISTSTDGRVKKV